MEKEVRINGHKILNVDTINQLLEYANDDKEEINLLLRSLIEDGNELYENIQNELKEKNYEALTFSLHTLKGVCGVIGANEMFELTKSCHNNVRLKNYQNLEEEVEKIHLAFDRLKKYIEEKYELKYLK